MVNGVPSCYFWPERGLRQGDPLSPFVFRLCAEALSAYIRKNEMEEMISGVRVAQGAAARNGFGKCLGIQADFRASKKTVFESICRGIECRIDGWAKQFLSPVGKKILIKSVAMAMLNHAMACFKLSVTTCNEMERVIAQFGWMSQLKTRGYHWVAWDKLTESKKVGGLGFRDLMGFNVAMLAKISWRVLRKPESMLSRVLKDKYFPNTSFLEASRQNKSSWGWNGILWGR
ncbi:hypothetical protein COP2_044677 [Malus domestica]